MNVVLSDPPMDCRLTLLNDVLYKMLVMVVSTDCLIMVLLVGVEDCDEAKESSC